MNNKLTKSAIKDTFLFYIIIQVGRRYEKEKPVHLWRTGLRKLFVMVQTIFSTLPISRKYNLPNLWTLPLLPFYVPLQPVQWPLFYLPFQKVFVP